MKADCVMSALELTSTDVLLECFELVWDRLTCNSSFAKLKKWFRSDILVSGLAGELVAQT